MRIGVLTFHSSRNFGANLQTLATQEMLRKLGHEPVIVNNVDEAKLAAFEKMVSVIRDHGDQAETLTNPHEKDSNPLVDGELGLPMSPLRWYSSLASCAGFIGMRLHGYVSCRANDLCREIRYGPLVTKGRRA